MIAPLPVLELVGEHPRTLGQQHGEMYRAQIKEIAEIRLERICAMPPHPRVKEVLSLAEDHLGIFKNFDENLWNEFSGIAEAANIGQDRLVVLNHYTDLRDLIPGSEEEQYKLSGKEDNGGCSIIYSPSGPILGQTWDIHGSAEPYVLLIKINDVLVFSMTGCLGMTGMNRSGVGVAINNLVSNDAKIGIVWPALVRKCLTKKTAIEARDQIMDAPIGSGRHFAIADKVNFFGIETSGTKKKIICDRNDQLYFHTNHCLDEEMRKTHLILKESTTLWRYRQLDEVIRYDDLASAKKVFLALARVSLPEDPTDRHKTATCGTFVMDLLSPYALACRGIASEEILSWNSTKHLLR